MRDSERALLLGDSERNRAYVRMRERKRDCVGERQGDNDSYREKRDGGRKREKCRIKML